MTEISSGAYVGISGRNEYFLQPDSTTRSVYTDAGDGNDVVSGYSVNTVYTTVGGLGVDLVFSGSLNDSIYGDRFWNDEITNVNPALAASADALYGGAGSDTIFGGGGNNFVNAGSENDYVVGGSGNELLEGGAGDDSVYGLAGNDQLFGGTAMAAVEAAFLSANVGTVTTNFNGNNDTASASTFVSGDYGGYDAALTDTGADYLDGGDGNDTIDGGDGADTMIGGTGNDTFYVDTAADKVIEAVDAAGGVDTVNSAVNYTLVSGLENLTLTGGASTGVGNTASNVMVGNAAANIFYGGGGNDTLTGGGGNDVFCFTYALSATTNVDTITDFTNAGGNDDGIRLENSRFTKLVNTGPLAQANFAANADGVAKQGDDFIVYETDTGKLFYDANGSTNGGSDSVQFALVANKAALTFHDFFVI